MMGKMLILCLFLGLMGCSSFKTLQGNIEYSDLTLKETYYQVVIESHDGIELTATVFQPAIPKGQVAPLVIHAHGFGVFRISSPYSLYAQVAVSGEAALQAWKQGYWVISYDQRGFGSSGGEISMMAPDKEVRDVSSVIDWAIKNIPNLKKDGVDFSIGMVGESYGGGAQLLASVFDKRIDAIVPITTWHDLSMTIEPKITKALWSSILYFGGELASGFDIDEESSQVFKNGITNQLSDSDVEKLAQRSLSFYCANEQFPQADALLIQAFTDTALTVNHALKNRDCFKLAQKDVRTLLIQNGHNVPLTDGLTRLPFYSNDNYVNCGEWQKKTSDIIVNWWDLKLKGNTSVSSNIPEYCITFDETQGSHMVDKEVNIRSFNIDKHEYTAGFSGRVEWLLQPLDMMLDVFRWGEDSDTLTEETKGGFFRPLFVPIEKLDAGVDVFGIPHIEVDLVMESDREPLVYVGLGVKRKAKRRVELVDYQVKALKGKGTQKVELPAVSARLEPGDTLGLLVYGYHSHYLFRGSFWPEDAYLQGVIKIPFLAEYK